MFVSSSPFLQENEPWNNIMVLERLNCLYFEQAFLINSCLADRDSYQYKKSTPLKRPPNDCSSNILSLRLWLDMDAINADPSLASEVVALLGRELRSARQRIDDLERAQVMSNV